MEIGKHSLRLLTGGGKRNHFEIGQGILFLTRSIENYYLLGLYWSLTDLEGGKHPSLVPYREKVMATHSSSLAWNIPWMEEPGRLQSVGSLRVGHD